MKADLPQSLHLLCVFLFPMLDLSPVCLFVCLLPATLKHVLALIKRFLHLLTNHFFGTSHLIP